MIEKIELRAPVLIDDEQVREITYDFDKISTDQFIEADVLASSAATNKGRLSAKIPELDTSFHYYLGIMAIIAVNPSYSVQDIERIKGSDIMKVVKIGRNFMTADVAEAEDEGSEPIAGLPGQPDADDPTFQEPLD